MRLRRAALFASGLTSAFLALALLVSPGWSPHLKYRYLPMLIELRAVASEQDAEKTSEKKKELIRLVIELGEAFDDLNTLIAAQASMHRWVGLVLVGVTAVTLIVWASLPHRETRKEEETDA